MTKRNEDLIRDFFNHGEIGKASRMQVTRHDDGSAFLWGFGWALYAYRKPDPETPYYNAPDVFVYTGWEGHSSTTSSHLHLLMPSHERFVNDVRPAVVIEEVDGDPGIKGSTGFKEFRTEGRDELDGFEKEDIEP